MDKLESGKRFWVLTLGSLAVVTLLVGWVVNGYYIERQIAQSSDRLMLLSTLRREAMARYLDTAEAELRFWSGSQRIHEVQAYFKARWQEYEATIGDPGARLRELYIENNPHQLGQRRELADAGDGSTYSELHAELHPIAKLFVTERGYYDFFLITPEGNIAYTVEKEDDFGTSLMSGPWRDTGLADVYRRAIAGAQDGAAVFSDLERYGPSSDAPALFMAKATLDDSGELLGVIAFQLPTDYITEIMHHGDTMGESGETYLVGRDLLMRSNSRFSEGSTILETTVDTATVRKALYGEEGVEFTPDYRGIDVLSAYTTLDIGDTQWAVMAEIDREEILARATSDRPWLAGLMLLLYGLGAWSVWFVQRSDFDAVQEPVFGDFDGGLDAGD